MKMKNQTIATRERLAARLVELRQAKGIGKNEMARRMGVSFQQVHNIERGTNNVGVDHVFNYLSQLGCEIKL